MLLLLAPASDRLLIAPKRQRQDLAILAQAHEPLDRDEPFDLLELRPQAGGDVEILLHAIRLGFDFEDNRVHRSVELPSPQVEAHRDSWRMPIVGSVSAHSQKHRNRVPKATSRLAWTGRTSQGRDRRIALRYVRSSPPVSCYVRAEARRLAWKRPRCDAGGGRGSREDTARGWRASRNR